MNIALNLKFKKLDDLCDQIFDYFHLVYYDLETKIDNELSINSIKNKFNKPPVLRNSLFNKA